MSLNLDLGTFPRSLSVKTNSIGHGGRPVWIGDYELTMADFCCMVEYVMTNTNLEENDHRLKLLEALRKAEIVEGYGSTPEDDSLLRIEIVKTCYDFDHLTETEMEGGD